MYEVLEGVRFIETGSSMADARGWGRGTGVSVFNGDRALVWEKEKVLEMIVVMVAQQCECA